MTYKVTFDEISCGGDFYDFEYGVAEEDDEASRRVTVRMSRNVLRELTEDVTAGQLPGVAAKAVEQYLLDSVPASAVAGTTSSSVTLQLATHTWYPGYPGPAEIIEHWCGFEVPAPKPSPVD